MKQVKVEERRVLTQDGTDIAYHVAGEGLPILLGNGLGGSWKAWRHQIGFLQDRFRFISWDYRGLYRSGRPRSTEALRIENHVQDGLAILEAEKIERAAIFGWSMGVQVALETFRQAPERVAALVLINGVAGRAWETVMDFEHMKHIIPPALRALQAIPTVANAVTRRAVSAPEMVTWAKRLGLAAPTLDEELWQELASSFRDLDMGVYFRILELLGEHDAHDVLKEIDVPTLMITGEKDLMTPRSAAEKIISAIKGSEMMVVPGGTHYVAVEQPELVNLRIEKFLRERGYYPEKT